MLFVVAAFLLSACASSYPVGSIYTKVSLPVGATSNAKGKKVGEASCKSILAMVAIGDCSIAAAKKNGNITSVTCMDWDAENILGIIGNYKLKVYGN